MSNQAIFLHDEAEQARQDWGEAPDVSVFYGRQEELETLEQWAVRDRCRVIAVLGLGGIGKTTLVTKLAEQIAPIFTHIIWRSLRNGPPVEEVLEECVHFLADDQVRYWPQALDGQIDLLIERLQTQRVLLVLDNLEAIVYGSECTYRDGYQGYGDLLRRVGLADHKSCLILTSRAEPHEFAQLKARGAALVRTHELRGMNQTEGRAILEDQGLFGSEEICQQFIDQYSGNPLALKLAAEPIRQLFQGDIARFLDEGEVISGGVHDLLDQQFNRLPDPEKEVMYWLAIKREMVSAQDLAQTASEIDVPTALEALQRRSLVDRSPAGFTLNTVVLNYVTEQLIEHLSAELKSESLWLFKRHALLMAQAKDYVRASQRRMIIAPLAERLSALYRAPEAIDAFFSRVLGTLRSQSPHEQGYAGGNMLNLLCQLRRGFVSGYDFSHITIRQADLQDVELHDVNLAFADLAGSIFTEVFGSVLAVAFSPDGAMLATGGTDGKIRLWEVGTRKQVLEIAGHTDWVRSIAFSPDGKRLASCGDDFMVRVWSLNSGKCLRTIDQHVNRVWSVAFSPDGKRLASSSEDRTVRVWDVKSKQCIRQLQEDSAPVWSIAFSPQGNRIAGGGDDKIVRVWNIDTGECMHKLKQHDGMVAAVAFSADGAWLASAGDDRIVRVWNLETGECAHRFEGHSSRVFSIAFAPAGGAIASAGDDQSLRVWNLGSGDSMILYGHTSTIWSVAFSPDGTRLASGADDQTVRIWEVSSGKCLSTIHGHTNAIWSVALDPKRALLVSGSEDQRVRLWDLASRQCLHVLQGHTNRVRSVAFSPDGAVVASGSEDQTVRLWNAYTGDCLRVLQGHTNRVRSVAFSPDGALVASSSEDQTVQLWRVRSGGYAPSSMGHANRIWSIAFSPDSQLLVSGGQDNDVRVWEVGTGNCLHTLSGHSERVMTVAFHANGRIIASGGDDRSVRIWDVESGRCLSVLVGHKGPVLALAFSPDGRLIASGGHDAVVKLWDVRSHRCRRTLHGHANRVWSVVFSGDSSQLISSGDDETIRFWDIGTGKTLGGPLRNARPYEHTNITGVTGLTKPQIETLKRLGALEDLTNAIEAPAS
jgi:WD40 repeat protein